MYLFIPEDQAKAPDFEIQSWPQELSEAKRLWESITTILVDTSDDIRALGLV